MSRTYKDKPKNDEKLRSSSKSDLFAEKVKAAYSQMGKLGGMARAKQMAERGFQPKSTATQPDDKKSVKSISKKPMSMAETTNFNTIKQKEKTMNTDIIKGHWHVIKGKLKTQWGKLTDDEIAEMEGTAEELTGALEKAYGYEKDHAEKEIKKFIDANKWDE